jgi:Flp pilus assembly pilin Flp
VFSIIRRFRRRKGDTSESGQTLVEYTLILMLVALLTVAALQAIGLSVLGFLNDAAAGIGGG